MVPKHSISTINQNIACKIGKGGKKGKKGTSGQGTGVGSQGAGVRNRESGDTGQ